MDTKEQIIGKVITFLSDQLSPNALNMIKNIMSACLNNAHIFAFSYGTSTGKPNCVPNQVYRSGAREITLSIANFLSTAVSKSVRQGYIIMIIQEL